MRIVTKVIMAAACVTASGSAMAAPTITSAALTGPSGTVWNTTVDRYYTLFVSPGGSGGAYVNPNDNFSGVAVTNLSDGEFDFSIAGDGFPTAVHSLTPSDPYYTLTLTLKEGSKTGTLSGVFTEATGLFVPTSSSVLFSSGHYSLTDFAWSRTLSNVVGAFSATNRTAIGPGSRADYQGAFTLTSSAVPEPATWALMILGFGMVGGALRAPRRRKGIVAAV